MALMKVKGNLERLFDKNLNDLVRGIRNHKDDEAKYIASCLEEIKQELRQHNTAVKANAVQKLTYLQMLGYDISWAGFNVVEVMASTKFTEKRVGYLSASQSFHKDTEVLMLTTNMIRKDLNSQNTHDAGVALSSLACFMSPDLARDLTGDILTLLTSTKPYIRKKAVLILYKVFLRYPEALRQAFPRLKEKLEDPDPGVQSAAVNVICELARKNPRNYLSLAPTFFKLMTTSQNNWMLIKIIKLFGALTPLEPRLGKKLIEPLTNLIHSTSAMSLLYECINTVIAVLISISSGMPNHTAAVQLCVQKLRILIEDSDQNLKYLGLLAMSQILKTNPKSVQGHKDLVLQCLDDSDESIRLRALDLLYGMVSKKNLMEIVKKLMVHMDKAEGTTYRDELMDKIIQICSQNDYQHITNFEWYITVLVELSRMEGGTKHGKLIASQMMDVTIRVATIRPFSVSQMALLLENHNVLLGPNSRSATASEVLYAASWICGEFAEHLSAPQDTLRALFKSKAVTSLPGHILSIYLQNGMKLFAFIAEKSLSEDKTDEVQSLAQFLEDKVLKDLVSSSDLEVQERASVMFHFVKYVSKHLEKGDNISQDFSVFFAGELNPVAAKAQKKVPVPEGLDLDAWINEPPMPEESEESEQSEEEERSQHNNDVFGVKNSSYDSPARKAYVEPSAEQLKKSREARLAQQSSDPFYLKGGSKSSPMKSMNDIPIQSIDLDVPLQIQGLASSDQYLEMKNGKKDKRKKKHKKKTEDVEEMEDDAPSVLVSKNTEMPDGVEFSDGDNDNDDDKANDDPHRALGEINLDELDTPVPYVPKAVKDHEHPIEFFGAPTKKKEKEAKKEKKEKKEKKPKKEKKEKKEKRKVNGENETPKPAQEDDDMEFWLSPTKQQNKTAAVEEAKPKSKHKKKSKSKKATDNDQDLMPKTNGTVSSSPLALKMLASNKDLAMSYDIKRVPMDPDKMTAGVSFKNVGSNIIAGVELDFIDTPNIRSIRDDPEKGIKLDMELNPGQFEDHLFLFQVSSSNAKQVVRGTATYMFQSGGQEKLDFKLIFHSSKFMIPDAEGLTDLLTAGALEHASSLTRPVKLDFNLVLNKMSVILNFAVVEHVENSAYMHAKSLVGGHSVAFLVKYNEQKSAVLIEGKATEPNILASLTDEIRDMEL